MIEDINFSGGTGIDDKIDARKTVLEKIEKKEDMSAYDEIIEIREKIYEDDSKNKPSAKATGTRKISKRKNPLCRHSGLI